MSQIATLDQTERFRKYCAVCARMRLTNKVTDAGPMVLALTPQANPGARCRGVGWTP